MRHWLRLLQHSQSCRHILNPTPCCILEVLIITTIGLNDLDEPYNDLLGFGITIVDEILKCKGQEPNSIQAFVIAIMFFKHILSLRMILRYLHDNLSESRVDILLDLNKALVNSSSKNRAHLKHHFLHYSIELC